jgi:integral membrane sensor domain MASE1
MGMKKKLQEINKVGVLKTFVAAHGYVFVAVAVTALAYVVLASIFGRDADDIVSYAQTAGIFSILGIVSVLASMIAVYKAANKYLFKGDTSTVNATALEILFVISSVLLYFVINGFNIFSYLFVMLVPTIAAYYLSKKRGEAPKKKKKD